MARHCGAAPAPAVERHARLLLLDTIGCALAGRRAPEIRALEKARGDGALGSLAAAATWDEACEGHAFAHGRPGVAVIGAVMPLAVKHGKTLGEMLSALVLGYEVGARAGGWLRVPAGIHVDGNWPALGAAAAAARLLGGSPAEIDRAVDAAACQLAYSLYLPVRSGSTIRNFYLQQSAARGMDAAQAALAGFGAPTDALTHYAGHYCRADQRPLPAADEDLILDAYFKPFAAVRHVHYGALAAQRLSPKADDVRSISLAIYEEAITYCGNRDPRTALAAQFSLSFGVAAMLRFGVLDASCYDEPKFSDPELRRLEKLVAVRADPAMQGRGCDLDIDGRRRAIREPEPQLSLDAAGVRAKFLRNAAAHPAASRFCDALLSPDATQPVRALWEVL